ncbi:MAG: SLC26A/SulP transporter family protein [Acidimicrobiia bacterium]|nr:SLC26A/SulP transporter family protein [Acidimicrobiia bacterium]
MLFSVAGGFTGAIVTVGFAISLATLVFSGPLDEHVATGIGLGLIGSLVAGVIVALFSSFRGMIAGVASAAAAVLAVGAKTIAETSPAPLPTVIALISVASLSVGIVFLVLGSAGLGGLTRFLPYPVIGGFLAGIGTLIGRGALDILFAMPPDLNNAEIGVWGPRVLGLVLAAVLFLGARFTSHRLLIPAALVTAIGVFHVVRMAAGVSVERAAELGLLLGPFSDGAFLPPSILSTMSAADWGAVVDQSSAIASLVIVLTISLLLFSSALEADTEEHVELDQELKVTGIANLVGGMFGAFPAYNYPGATVVARTVAINSRTSALIAALLAGVVLVGGGRIAGLVPTPVTGGLLLYMGGYFVAVWAWDTRTSMPRLDYILVLVIVLAIALIGFLPGIAIGLLIAVGLFVFRYSKVSVIRRMATLKHRRSHIDRSAPHRHLLEVLGHTVLVIELKGFIFFGTAHLIRERIECHINENAELRYVILDFSHVTGVDSTAGYAMSKVARFAGERGVGLILSGNRSLDLDLLLGLDKHRPLEVRTDRDLDYALEWCEEQILASSDRGPTASLESRLRAATNGHADVDHLLSMFEHRVVPAATKLLVEGEASPGMYFIERGAVTVQLEKDRIEPLRLRGMRAGTVVGEIGLYLGAVCTATVVTDSECEVYQLHPERFRQLEEDGSAAAAALHRYIASTLADRLRYADDTIHSLSE